MKYIATKLTDSDELDRVATATGLSISGLDTFNPASHYLTYGCYGSSSLGYASSPRGMTNPPAILSVNEFIACILLGCDPEDLPDPPRTKLSCGAEIWKDSRYTHIDSWVFTGNELPDLIRHKPRPGTTTLKIDLECASLTLNYSVGGKLHKLTFGNPAPNQVVANADDIKLILSLCDA